jgi:hypothetical protein
VVKKVKDVGARSGAVVVIERCDSGAQSIDSYFGMTLSDTTVAVCADAYNERLTAHDCEGNVGNNWIMVK